MFCGAEVGPFQGGFSNGGSSSGLLAIWHCLVVTVCGSGHRMFVFVIDGAHKQTLSPLYAIFFPWISWSFCRILVAANDAGVLDRSASVCFQCCQESFLLCSHLVRTQMEWWWGSAVKGKLTGPRNSSTAFGKFWNYKATLIFFISYITFNFLKKINNLLY